MQLNYLCSPVAMDTSDHTQLWTSYLDLTYENPLHQLPKIIMDLNFFGGIFLHSLQFFKY